MRTEDPGFESLLWPHTELRVGPYISRQGGTVTPFFRVRRRLTKLESPAQVTQGGGDSNLVLSDSCDFFPPCLATDCSMALGHGAEKTWTSWRKNRTGRGGGAVGD